MKKRILCAVLASLCCLTMLAGCGKKECDGCGEKKKCEKIEMFGETIYLCDDCTDLGL